MSSEAERAVTAQERGLPHEEVPQEQQAAAYEEWKSRLAMDREEKTVLMFPVDVWSDLPERIKNQEDQPDVLTFLPLVYLDQERFDLLRMVLSEQGHEVDDFKNLSPALRAFFENSVAVRAKINELLKTGRRRSATYLIQTVEQFFPKIRITSTEFADALPEYPALPVSYKDMREFTEPEKLHTEPFERMITFCVAEAMLGDLLHLKHDFEKVLSSPTLSDEAKDGTSRLLRLRIEEQIQRFEAELDDLGEQFAREFFTTVQVRLRTTATRKLRTLAPGRWRDEEDMLNALVATKDAFEGPWADILQGLVRLYTVKFRPEGATKGEVRGMVDHMIDQMHNGGSVMAWLDRGNEGQSVGLNFLPLIFLEVRKHLAGKNSAREMVDSLKEFSQLAERSTPAQIRKYRESVETPGRGQQQEELRAFEKEFPIVAHTLRESNEYFATDLISGMRDLRDPRFTTLKSLMMSSGQQLGERAERQQTQVAGMREALEKLKQTYGYRAS